MTAQTATITTLEPRTPYQPETARAVLAAYDGFSDTLLHEPDWLAVCRDKSREIVARRGLPTAKLEGWKYTNIPPLVKTINQSGTVKITHKEGHGIAVHSLTGMLGEEWVQKAITAPLSDKEYNTENTLWHLGNLFLRDGLVIDVPANTEAKTPLDLTMVADGGLANARLIIRLGVNARLTVIEHHNGAGSYWKNIQTQIILADGAHLTHVRYQEDSEQSIHTQLTHTVLGKDSGYEGIVFSTGSRLFRNQLHGVMNGAGAVCSLSAVNLLTGQQHGDTTILVDHMAPNGNSNQNIRTVLDGTAHGVFQGKVHVHQPAQKTDGYQLSKSLILNEGAEMDTKPELEIYADDVKCSHGATTGQLDEGPLFYMRARGIPEAQARALLIEAFVDEAFDRVADETIQSVLKDKVKAWLAS